MRRRKLWIKQKTECKQTPIANTTANLRLHLLILYHVKWLRNWKRITNNRIKMKPLKFNAIAWFYGMKRRKVVTHPNTLTLYQTVFVSHFLINAISFSISHWWSIICNQCDGRAYIVTVCLILRGDRDLTISISSISYYTSSVHPWQGKNGGRAACFLFLSFHFWQLVFRVYDSEQVVAV